MEKGFKTKSGKVLPYGQWQKIHPDFSVRPMRTTAHIRHDPTGEIKRPAGPAARDAISMSLHRGEIPHGYIHYAYGPDIYKKSFGEEFVENDDKNQLDEATRKHFQMVADTLQAIKDPGMRGQRAAMFAKEFSKMNPRFSHEKFYAAAGVPYKVVDKKGNVKLRENEETIDELSDVTRRNYADAAGDELDKSPVTGTQTDADKARRVKNRQRGINRAMKEDTTWDILRGVAAERPADVEALVKSAILDRVYDKVAAQREEIARSIFKDKPAETEAENDEEKDAS